MGSVRPTEFPFTEQPPEEHARKMAVLKAHPEIKELMKPEWRTKYMVLAATLLQLCVMAAVKDCSWPVLLGAAYVVGATITHSQFLAVHELSHGLGASTIAGNRLIGMVANLCVGVPYSITFKAYHMKHHRYLGVDIEDTDIPSHLEAWLVSKTATCYPDHCARKAIWMFGQILAYALRPMMLRPDLATEKPSWLLLSWAVQLAFDAAVYWAVGANGILYMLLSLFLAGSIHPTAGHFLAEHYLQDGKTETYSYYGPVNWVTYNVGFHNEHHDFPNIPWSGLPKVRQIAAEFYEPLPQCKSYVGLLCRFIFDENLSMYSRMKRPAVKKS